DADGHVVTGPESESFPGRRNGGSGIPLADYPGLREEASQILDRANGVWVIPPELVLLRADAHGPPSPVVQPAAPPHPQSYALSPYVSSKLVDREGNIWFGDEKGVHRFFYSQLIRQELPKNEGAYFTVTADDQGAVWITAGAENARVFRVANGRVEPRDSQRGLVGFTYRSPDKTLWVGRAHGLWRLSDGRFVRVELPEGIADQSAFLQTITQ